DAVTVALRTQQILAEETGVALTIDPLGGSYFLETLTDQMEAQAQRYIDQIDAMGGMIHAIDNGFPQKEIADAAYRYQLMEDRGEKVTVGVNKYVRQDEKPINYLRIDEQVEAEQIERTGRFKAARDMSRVERRLKQLAEACRNGGNVMPVLVDAVKDYASLGEISDVYRQGVGLYREPIILLGGGRGRVMTDAIRITKATNKKDRPKDKDLAFGNVFTDHMFVANFQEEKGWYDPRVEPYGPFPLDPATAVLHYRQSLFEGLKAFRGADGTIRLFRPQKHVERLNRTATRMTIPQLDPELILRSWTTLVDVDRDWVPSSVATSLYIRPTIIASEPFLGVRP